MDLMSEGMHIDKHVLETLTKRGLGGLYPHREHNIYGTHPYLLCNIFSHLLETLPEGVLSDTEPRELLTETEPNLGRLIGNYVNALAKFNTDRENTMAKTMVKHIRDKPGCAMTSLGNMHFREGSYIYPELDQHGVKYVVMSLEEPSMKEGQYAWQFDHPSLKRLRNNENLTTREVRDETVIESLK